MNNQIFHVIEKYAPGVRYYWQRYVTDFNSPEALEYYYCSNRIMLEVTDEKTFELFGVANHVHPSDFVKSLFNELKNYTKKRFIFINETGEAEDCSVCSSATSDDGKVSIKFEYRRPRF